MNLTVFLLSFAGADLISWNRLTGLTSKTGQFIKREIHVSHQDSVIRELIKNKDYAKLNRFLDQLRHSQQLYKQKQLLSVVS